MSVDPLSDGKILDSWNTNASAWTTAVRQERIGTGRTIALADNSTGGAPLRAIVLTDR